MGDKSYFTATKTYKGYKLCAKWYGGPYIDVGLSFGKPVEVINVWDYEKSTPTIPFTQKALSNALAEWVREYDEEEPGMLLQDIREGWLYF